MTYDIVCWTYDIVENLRHRRFLPHCCQSYVRHRIRCRIRCRTSDVLYRILYHQNVRHRRFLPHCCQSYPTMSYTMSYVNVRYRIRCALQHRYYTMSYVYIVCNIGIIRCRTSISAETYDETVRRRMRFSDVRYAIRSCLLVFPGAVGTRHWHLRQSGSHPAVMGSARAVSYVISVLTVRVCKVQVVSDRLPVHGASDCHLCASRRGSSVRALNPSYDCPHFGTINLHARARANVCARDIKGDLTPLQGM